MHKSDGWLKQMLECHTGKTLPCLEMNKSIMLELPGPHITQVPPDGSWWLMKMQECYYWLCLGIITFKYANNKPEDLVGQFTRLLHTCGDTLSKGITCCYYRLTGYFNFCLIAIFLRSRTALLVWRSNKKQQYNGMEAVRLTRLFRLIHLDSKKNNLKRVQW